MATRPRFKVGDRVAFDPDPIDLWRASCDAGQSPAVGELGTVGEVATGRGVSVYPDPLKSMVFVNWDRAGYYGVARASARRVK